MSELSVPPFPPYVLLETTRLCNARCGHCPNQEISKAQPFIADALFDKIMADVNGNE